jgi:hypothetical protein
MDIRRAVAVLRASIRRAGPEVRFWETSHGQLTSHRLNGSYEHGIAHLTRLT